MRKLLILSVILCSGVLFYGCQAKTYEDAYETYASYIADSQDTYEDLLTTYNEMTTTWIKTSVMINNVIDTLDFSASGSGVIIFDDDTYYYVLTNSHVIGGEHLLDYQHDITVIDMTGLTYSASLVAMDDDFDLAVIQFMKTQVVYPEIVLANSNPDHAINVAVLGHPNRQVNAITVGKYLDMTTVDLDDQSIGEVTFPVMKLDVPVQAGSSGSLVMNEEHQMIGLIFAGNFYNGSNATLYSYAIPIESIHAFLNQNSIGDETS